MYSAPDGSFALRLIDGLLGTLELLLPAGAKSNLPISKDWFATGLFPKKTSTGPTSRSQDLLTMVRLFQSWVESGELFKANKQIRDNFKRI